MTRTEQESLVDRKRAEKVAAFTVAIDAALKAVAANSHLYALNLVEKFDDKMWTAVAAKAHRPEASAKTREMVLAVYRARVAKQEQLRAGGAL